MPRYFFSQTDGGRDNDDQGTDLPNLTAARIEAIITMGHTLKDDPKFVWTNSPVNIEVTDVTGAVVSTVTVSAS